MVHGFRRPGKNSTRRRSTRLDIHSRHKTHKLCRSKHPTHQSTSHPNTHPPLCQFRNYKLIYRRYAGLFFCLCVDSNDNNLAYLEAIHNFVEVLDKYFGNVCELDLVFNFYKVYTIVDEVFLAGEIMETSQAKILLRLEQLDALA
eukprot:Sdes_comp18675_c0_seq4m8927